MDLKLQVKVVDKNDHLYYQHRHPDKYGNLLTIIQLIICITKQYTKPDIIYFSPLILYCLTFFPIWLQMIYDFLTIHFDDKNINVTNFMISTAFPKCDLTNMESTVQDLVNLTNRCFIDAHVIIDVKSILPTAAKMIILISYSLHKIFLLIIVGSASKRNVVRTRSWCVETL